MTQIKKHKIFCYYHTNELCEYDIYAKSLADAKEIARIQFDDDHTDKCILDEASVCRK